MSHPKKKNLKAKRIYHFQPDFPILHMQLASIKPDQKYRRKNPKNKCLITRRFGIGQMELLDLYETCVDPDHNQKKRREPFDDSDSIMGKRIDFLKRNACQFENLNIHAHPK